MVVALFEQPIVTAPRRGAARIALMYMAIGLAWITGSDHVVAALFADQHLAIAQTLKGYAYVLLTSYLLYVTIARLFAHAGSTQQRLAQFATTYRNLFESHPHPLFVYDPDTLRFLAVNQAALTKYGYTRAEFLALTVQDLRPPDEFNEFHRALNAHKYFDALSEYGPVRHWTKDRRLLDMQISTNTLDFDGNRCARVALALDVTERIRAERALHDAQRHLKDMERLARVGWWSIERATGVMMLSAQMQNLIAIDSTELETTKEVLFQRVHADDREALRQAYDRTWQGLPLQIEIRIERADNEIVWLWLRGELNTRADTGEQLIGTALDITERKQIERDIQQSEVQYRRLIDYLPEAVLLHCNARVTFANPAALALFGAAKASDVLDLPIEQFIAAPSLTAARERFAAIHGPTAEMGFQERLLKKLNGEVFSAEVAVQPLLIDGRLCVQAVVRDIGVQKKAQMELQLANERLLHLSGHMTEVSENERRQLSRELHDDLGQALTFIKMTTAWLRKRVTTTELTERIDQINAVAGDALAKVRDLALALRPAQLEALGLKAAMEEHIQRFCAGSGIEYEMQLQQLEPRPQPALEIALFRIFQEALTNIFRHAGANFIEVALTRRDAAIVLRVVDDGRGFDVSAALAVGAGLGLQSMVERAQQLHGTLQWHSVAGVGTELVAVIPEPIV